MMSRWTDLQLVCKIQKKESKREGKGRQQSRKKQSLVEFSWLGGFLSPVRATPGGLQMRSWATLCFSLCSELLDCCGEPAMWWFHGPQTPKPRELEVSPLVVEVEHLQSVET